MKVYAAGSLYFRNNQLVGTDTRSGHYYFSFAGQDGAISNQVTSFLGQLGYDTSVIKSFWNGQDVVSSYTF